MIIACPACNTRYVVPDSAIGVDGRTVRCAKCKHSWFQEGPEIALPERPVPSSPASIPTPAPAPPEHSDRMPPVAPRNEIDYGVEEAQPSDAAAFTSDGEVEEENAPDFDQPYPPFDDLPANHRHEDREPDFTDSVGQEEESQFDYAPPFRPRRNWLKIWTWAAGLFAVLALSAVAAVNFLGVPDWVPIQRPLFAIAQPDLTLDFPVEEQERRTLANGTEFFGARISVTNEARESRDVPPILIVLRDARERIVYSWEVVPPQSSLAPGETMTINEAITDVPKAAVFADIGWAPR